MQIETMQGQTKLELHLQLLREAQQNAGRLLDECLRSGGQFDNQYRRANNYSIAKSILDKAWRTRLFFLQLRDSYRLTLFDNQVREIAEMIVVERTSNPATQEAFWHQASAAAVIALNPVQDPGQGARGDGRL